MKEGMKRIVARMVWREHPARWLRRKKASNGRRRRGVRWRLLCAFNSTTSSITHGESETSLASQPLRLTRQNVRRCARPRIRASVCNAIAHQTTAALAPHPSSAARSSGVIAAHRAMRVASDNAAAKYQRRLARRRMAASYRGGALQLRHMNDG